MGIVYKAHDPDLNRNCALKVLIAGEDASEDAISRFHREAAAVAKLGHHPGIVPVHDIGQVGNLHYFAMHFVDGRPLDDLINEGEVAPKRAVVVAMKIARALQHAHDHGILHRDIKPANVLTESDGNPQITDFGLAKDVDSDERYTATGVAMGSPHYMPPEQAQGRLDQVDARSDVYSLGATLYEMLTFQTPFDGDNVINIVKKVILDDPRPPRRINPIVPRDVETICLKCLEKEPEKRYASAKDLADDLQRYLDGDPILARPASIVTKVVKKARKYKGMVALGAVSFLLLASLGTFLVYRQVENQRRYEQNMADGKKLEKAGDYSKAVKAFNAALTIYEGDADATEALARAETLDGEQKAAEKAAAEAQARRKEQEKQWAEGRQKLRTKTAEIRGLIKGDDQAYFDQAEVEAMGLVNLKLSPQDQEKVTALIEEVSRAKTSFETATRNQRIKEGFAEAQRLEREANRQVEKQLDEDGVLAFEAALEKYLQVLSEDPENPILQGKAESLALTTIVDLYLKLRNFDGARRVVRDYAQSQVAPEARSQRIDPVTARIDQSEKTSGQYKELLAKGRDRIVRKLWEEAIGYLTDAQAILASEDVKAELRRARRGLFRMKARQAEEERDWKGTLAWIEKARAQSDAPDEEDAEAKRVAQKGHQAELDKARKALLASDPATARIAIDLARSLSSSTEADRLQSEIAGALERPEGMVYVHSGVYAVGMVAEREGDENPNPKRSVKLEGFYIGETEVTNREFLEFVKSGGYENRSLWTEAGWKARGRFFTSQTTKLEKPCDMHGPAAWVRGEPADLDLPVRGVSWHEARAYARYRRCRLPTEDEWEVAAAWNPREGQARVYPWGNAWDARKGRFRGEKPLAPGRAVNPDLSACGCRDMAGNLIEWVVAASHRTRVKALVKGVAYNSEAASTFARCAWVRPAADPSIRPLHIGFRLAKTPGADPD